MASTTDNNNGKDKKEVMQSNLPLLFANGSPIGLESMSLSELQRFFLFLMKCEFGRTISTLNDLDQPSWWPAEVAFEDSLLETTSKKGMWSSVLRKLLQRCYEHHNSSFLLEFSRKLMIATQDANKIKVIDNGDGTRSMRSASSDKLLVTFRSENQDYDKKLRQQINSFSTQSPLKNRCSLSLGINASDPRLPRCEDVYLCDNCGTSFESLQDVLVHENTCLDESTERADAFHRKYFSYLRLEPISTKDSYSCSTSSSKVVRPKPSTYAKFLSIDVSSPLGQYIYSLSSSTTKDTIDISTLCTAERKSALRSLMPQNSSDDGLIISTSDYLPDIFESGHGEEFPVTYKGNRLRKAKKEDPHLYCFTRQQKAVRMYTLQHGLTPRSMRLYKEVRKRKLKVSIQRLDMNSLSDFVKSWITNNARHKAELKDKAKLRRLKEQARHFEPYVPKLTSSYQLSNRSSVSVLQSFTSAVQQLCSPEKKVISSTTNIKQKAKLKPSLPPPVIKKSNGTNPQCIDLCSSSDDEVELRTPNLMR